MPFQKKTTTEQQNIQNIALSIRRVNICLRSMFALRILVRNWDEVNDMMKKTSSELTHIWWFFFSFFSAFKRIFLFFLGIKWLKLL